MENKTRQPFKKYKELRVYFAIRTYVLKQDAYETDIERPFEWFKFSARGVIIKDKHSGMEIHFKYSDVTPCDASYSRGLVLEDAELYTPFIKEDNTVKFITWKEWDEKYNTEEICKRITSVTDEHLKEHDTDLMYILDKMCVCAGSRNFDHPYQFITVEARYQNNEYTLHRVAADFKWHYGARTYDYIQYLFEYKRYQLRIIINKYGTGYTGYYHMYGINIGNTSIAGLDDSFDIMVEFNKDYSISKITVKHDDKESLLGFFDMGNSAIKNTITQIRDYINAKLTEKQLISHINTSKEKDKYVQTWNFSPIADVRPNTESILKANERAETYNIEETDTKNNLTRKQTIEKLDKLANNICYSDERDTWVIEYFYERLIALLNKDKSKLTIKVSSSHVVGNSDLNIEILFNKNGNITAINIDDVADIHNKIEIKELKNFVDELYNTATLVKPTAYFKIWEYLNTKMTGLNSWIIKKGEPFKFEYNDGPFKKTEVVHIRTVENDSFINLLFQSTDMRAIETVYKMEITITFDDDGNIKDYAMINKELIDKFEGKNIINLLKFLSELCPNLLTWPFTLNKHGDIYTQLKNECEWIFNHPKATQTYNRDRTSICSGYILYVSSGSLLDPNRERIRFQFEGFATFHRITIEVLDPNREKLRITIGVEGSELVSVAVYPSFDKFEAVIGTIHNPSVKRLVSEIFNKLYKGNNNE